MPRKNKEEYNEYMRNYMKKKTRENRGVSPIEGDFDPSASTEGKPALNINKAGDLIKQTQDLLKNKDSETEDDPILKAIDKYGKYIPLAMKFFEGMKGSISQYNQQDKTPKLQAPEGWLNATPMQRLGWKYSRPEWYAAGERYDAAVVSGYHNPQINNNYVDPTYTGEAQPQNLQQLARKYPEAPIVHDAPPQAPQQTSNTDGEKPCDLPVVKEKAAAEGETKSAADTSNQEDQLISELQQDNLKYINLGSDFINGLTDEEFSCHLKNIDDLVEKAKPFMSLIPVHVKGMIVQTSKEDLEALFKEKCPDKFKILEKEKQAKKLLELFEGLQKMISDQK